MSYNIGDIVIVQGVEYTIWFIEDGIYHIRDIDGNGHCGDEIWLNHVQNL